MTLSDEPVQSTCCSMCCVQAVVHDQPPHFMWSYIHTTADRLQEISFSTCIQLHLPGACLAEQQQDWSQSHTIATARRKFNSQPLQGRVCGDLCPRMRCLALCSSSHAVLRAAIRTRACAPCRPCSVGLQRRLAGGNWQQQQQHVGLATTPMAKPARRLAGGSTGHSHQGGRYICESWAI